MFGVSSRSEGPNVQIAKAENGYMVTLDRGGDGGNIFESLGVAFSNPQEPPNLEALKKERERLKSHVFVYSDVEDAWAAIKEFLLDGRLPKIG